MRKSLIITLLLLLLSLGGIYAAHAGVNINKDEVVLDETILYGDKVTAEGLVIDIDTHCNNHLFWNTVYELGIEPQINTDFRFSQKQEYQQHERIYYGVEFGISDSGGFSASAGIDLDNDSHFIGSYFYSMKDLYKDVASRTGAGQTHRESLYFKDYYDFYPLVASLDLPDYHWDMRQEIGERDQAQDDGSEPFIQAIRDYFRIPVLDDHRLEVSIAKNDEGLITEIDTSPIGDSGVSLWTTSLVTDDACYFTFNNQAQNGELLDLSLIPDGYGLYRLPLTKAAEGEKNSRISLEQMEMVYALDPQVHITELKLTEDESKLLLMTREDEAYYLTTLNAVTAQELQKLKVIDCDEDVYLWSFYSDRFIVGFVSDGRLTVIEATDSGEYRGVFTVDTPASDAIGMPRTSNAAMSWDGERLAVAEPQLEEDMNSGRYEKCGFNLSVYDESGLLYAGKYDSSLDINRSLDYSYRCRPLDLNPIYLRWPEK